MRAHTPPFTNPEAAYDSRRLYEETSAIAAAQDAKHAMTDAERDAKLRTVAHYIYHAKLLIDEVFGEDRQRRKGALRDVVRESERLDLYSNADTPAKSPHDDFAIAQDAPDLPLGWLASGGAPVESAYLASFGPNDWQAETLREYSIGDVEPRHPMHAEALRDHDERLFGGEDRL